MSRNTKLNVPKTQLIFLSTYFFIFFLNIYVYTVYLYLFPNLGVIMNFRKIQEGIDRLLLILTYSKQNGEVSKWYKNFFKCNKRMKYKNLT
jgi:hypothetical protein